MVRILLPEADGSTHGGWSEADGENGGDERGMQEGLEGTRPLGVDLVQTVDRRVQSDTELSGKGLARIR
jgi:hypothetical protein